MRNRNGAFMRIILFLFILFFQVINCSQTVREKHDEQILQRPAKIYVACQADDVVSVIDVAENRLIRNIPVAMPPKDLTVSPNQNLLGVVHETAGLLSLIDTHADTLKGKYRFPQGVEPLSAEFATDSTLLCLVRSSRPLVQKPVGNLYLLYINLFSTDELTVLGQNQFASDLKIIYAKKYGIICVSAGDPWSHARPLSPGWVVDFETGKTLAKARGLGPYDIELSPDGEYIYSNIFADGLIKWDIQRQEGTRLARDRGWGQFELSSNGKWLYGFGADLKRTNLAIVYVDIATMKEQRHQLSYPLETSSFNRTKMALARENNTLYFIRYFEGLVVAFDIVQKKIVREVATGKQPVDLLYVSFK